MNQTVLQPFVTHTLPSGFGLILDTESTYDWRSEEWTLPVFAGVTPVLKIGNQPISLQFGGRAEVDGPDAAPDWGIRFNVVFLYPTKKS